jgi:hypothetical protein
MKMRGSGGGAPEGIEGREGIVTSVDCGGVGGLGDGGAESEDGVV